MSTIWIPTPLPLDAGPPFLYPEVAISTISHTEAFVTAGMGQDALSVVIDHASNYSTVISYQKLKMSGGSSCEITA